MNKFLQLINRLSTKQLLVINIMLVVVCGAIFVVMLSAKTSFIKFSRKAGLNSTPRPVAAPTPTPTPAPNPVRITIPKMNINTGIVGVGLVSETKQMDVPENAMEVGWYKYGPSPGETGAAILNGHLDTPTGAPAIFYFLNSLIAGDEFYITNEIGERMKFIVNEVYNLPLDNFPKDLIYGKRDYSQVSLITCSGIWNQATKSYSNRIAVIAKKDPAYLETDYLVEIPSKKEAAEQFIVQTFAPERHNRQINLPGVYLRLEPKQGKIAVFLATSNQNVIAADVVLRFDPQVLEINTSIAAFTNEFASFNIHRVNNHTVRLSLFTDPSWKTKVAVNSKDKEIKIAEVDYSLRVKDFSLRQTMIDLVKAGQTPSSVVLKPIAGKEVHQSENILDTVQGTVVKI